MFILFIYLLDQSFEIVCRNSLGSFSSFLHIAFFENRLNCCSVYW
jgi:hypothetical protein